VRTALSGKTVSVSTQKHRDEHSGYAGRHDRAQRLGAARPARFAVRGDLPGRCAKVWRDSLRVMRRAKRADRMIVCSAVVVGLAVIVALSQAQVGASATPAAPRHTVLHPPTDLSVFGRGDGVVVLSWQPPQPPPVGYRIYRATGRHGRYTIVGEVTAPDMDTFTDSPNLLPGTTYAYTVTAFDRQGQSAPVGPIIALVLAAPGPTPTVAVPAPLPTFAAPLPPTLTALARSSRQVQTP
jgi:Fibronectin type III domain